MWAAYWNGSGRFDAVGIELAARDHKAKQQLLWDAVPPVAPLPASCQPPGSRTPGLPSRQPAAMLASSRDSVESRRDEASACSGSLRPSDRLDSLVGAPRRERRIERAMTNDNHRTSDEPLSHTTGGATFGSPDIADAPDPADLEGCGEWVGTRLGPTAIDLFSGAGGLSLGLRDAGFSVLLGADWDARAVETHNANIGGLGYVGDLSDPAELIDHLDGWGINDVDLSRAAFLPAVLAGGSVDDPEPCRDTGSEAPTIRARSSGRASWRSWRIFGRGPCSSRTCPTFRPGTTAASSWASTSRSATLGYTVDARFSTASSSASPAPRAADPRRLRDERRVRVAGTARRRSRRFATRSVTCRRCRPRSGRSASRTSVPRTRSSSECVTELPAEDARSRLRPHHAGRPAGRRGGVRAARGGADLHRPPDAPPALPQRHLHRQVQATRLGRSQPEHHRAHREGRLLVHPSRSSTARCRSERRPRSDVPGLVPVRWSADAATEQIGNAVPPMLGDAVGSSSGSRSRSRLRPAVAVVRLP